ncbi:MAG: GNAT family N-acetyltransferase [Pseudomonadota bacterium]
MGLARAAQQRGTNFAIDDGAATSIAEHPKLAWMTATQVSTPDFVSAWEQLALNACEPNPFYEPWFVLPSFETLTSGVSIKIAAVFEGKELIGLLPMKRSRDYYGYSIPHLSSWLHNNAFCGVPLIRKGAEKLFWISLLAACDVNPGRSLFLHLPSLPAHGPATHALDKVLCQTGLSYADVHSRTRAMLASKHSPDAYIANALTNKRRKELRRHKRRLEDKGELTFDRDEADIGIEAWADEFLQLEAAGWKGEAGSALASNSTTAAFFHTALRGAAQNGRLERLTLRLDGRPIAMLANLISPPGAYSFKTAFDEDYAAHSPGVLIQLENLTMLDRQDVEWTDSCAMQGHSMIERLWTERRELISRNIAIGGPVRRFAFSMLSKYETRTRSDK